MQFKPFILAGIIAMVLLSCNDNNAGGTNEKAESDNSSTEAKAKTDDDKSEVRANIDVTITGGDMAGSYSAVCRDACCSWGLAGENVFGNQYSETGKGPKELSSVQLVVADVTGNKTTKEFLVTVSFGELFSNESKSFNIDTRPGNQKGSGTLDIQYEGEKAVVTIKGVSAEGPSIDLKMNCRKVITAKNLGQ